MIQISFTQNDRHSQGKHQDRQAFWCAFAAIVSVLYFSTAVVILHPLRPDLNPITHAVSNYAVGAFGFLMTSAFFVLAFSEFALARGLMRCLSRGRQATAAVVLLVLAGIGLLVTGLFRSDINVSRPPASASALVHWTGAGISFLSLMIAILLLSGCFKQDARWQSIARPSYAWLAAIVLALAAYAALSTIDWTGVGERVYLAVCVSWLLFVSLRLRTLNAHE